MLCVERNPRPGHSWREQHIRIQTVGFKATLMGRFHTFLTCFWLGTVQVTHADPRSDAAIPPAIDCSATDQLVVLSGAALAPLLGTPVRQLSLFKASAAGLTPIAFQVDRRDAQGRYIIEEADIAGLGDAILEFDDEVVFLAADTGVRLSDTSHLSKTLPLVEIRLGDAAGLPTGWLYVSVSGDPQTAGGNRHVQYDPASDTVTGAAYQLTFNRRLPFLVDTFRWKSGDSGGWSPDVIDTMKIRHHGRFLGFIPFRRTQRDYTSRLSGTKIGPLRVIRRTENRIRMLWHLKTPAVYIDYVMMPGGFVMDTVIDIPFDVGLFFSDVETLTSVDLDGDPALPRFTIQAPGYRPALVIDGHMSSEKRDFNLLQSNQFGVSSSLGKMLVGLEIPTGVPITPWLYLRDAQDEADPPENRVGQFGNVGFRITGWEHINRQLQHVKFAVCLEAQG